MSCADTPVGVAVAASRHNAAAARNRWVLKHSRFMVSSLCSFEAAVIPPPSGSPKKYSFFSWLFLTAVPGEGTGVNRRDTTFRPHRRIRRDAADTEVCVDAIRTSTDAGSIVRRKLLLSAPGPHFHVQPIDVAGYGVLSHTAGHHKVGS